MANQNTETVRLTIKQVMERTGKSRGTIWRWVREGEFPPPLNVGKDGARIVWRESDVAAWLATQ
jgi:prophage regulatory protein